MSISLKNVFSKQSSANEREKIAVVDPKHYSISDAQDAYFRYLYPNSSAQKLTVPQKLVMDLVKQSLQKKEDRQKAVPRLPTVIPRLLQSLRDPESAAKHYVDIINKDPVMSAAVLKLANSVYFNPIGARISEIERAVVKLGIDGLRSVLSAAVMQPIIQRDSPYFSKAGHKMWHHSLQCAVTCEIIADYRGMEKFKMYVLGLVHDIGRTTIFSELCKQFKKNSEDVKPGYNAFVPILKVLGPAVSYWISKDWDLPKEVCTALAEQTNVQVGSMVGPAAHVLYQANLITEAHVTLRTQNEKRANKLLEELELPLDIYDKLDQLSKEV